MKILFLLLSLVYLSFAQEQEEDTNIAEPMLIEDTSGLSDTELREKAKQIDKGTKPKNKVSISEVAKTADDTGEVDISAIQEPWEKLSPTPTKYDWVQTKSGEWFKGKIKAMYDDNLEFDSEEIGLYTFKFKDIEQIKSYHIVEVNIEGVASIPGILRYKDNTITIIQGDDTYAFDRSQIVSLAHSGEKELHYWSGKMTFSIDIRSGNKTQFDYSAKANVKRRTATTRLALDYLGRISSVEDTQTANDHRINEKYDIYLTRYFFWTPLFSEYYQDKFKNIESQYTAGVGIGYTLLDTNEVDWDLSGGPAVIHTQYETFLLGEESSATSFALEISTRFEYELSKRTDFNYQYKLTFTDKYAGRYKHHMVLSFENEILEWLDFDITGVWDYTYSPEVNSDGTQPLRNDYQLLMGLGIEF
jgi:hypothetical protein